jgi:hypothetical protein
MKSRFFTTLYKYYGYKTDQAWSHHSPKNSFNFWSACHCESLVYLIWYGDVTVANLLDKINTGKRISIKSSSKTFIFFIKSIGAYPKKSL